MGKTASRLVVTCALLTLAVGLVLSGYSFFGDIPLPWAGSVVALGVALMAIFLAIRPK